MKLIAKAKVVLTAAVTYFVIASSIVTVGSQKLAEVVPAGWQDNVVSYAGIIVGVLGGAVLVIRSVTPLLPGEKKSILPTAPPEG